MTLVPALGPPSYGRRVGYRPTSPSSPRRARAGRFEPGVHRHLPVAADTMLSRSPPSRPRQREGWGGGHGGSTPGDQVPHSEAGTRPGTAAETDRAPEPPGRVGVDPRLRSGRVRQDDAADGVARRVAGRRPGRGTVRGVVVARPS